MSPISPRKGARETQTRMKRIIAPFLILLIAAFAIGLGRTSAGAEEDWCDDDPLISVQGRTLDIQVGVPVSKVSQVRSVDIVVTVPKNVSAKVVSSGPLFKDNIQFVHTNQNWDGISKINVAVQTRVNATGSFNTTMMVTHRDGLLH